jgi:hypothetical protein
VVDILDMLDRPKLSGGAKERIMSEWKDKRPAVTAQRRKERQARDQ